MIDQPTKLSSANLPPYDDYNGRSTTSLGLICHLIEVIYVHKWWDPHIVQGSYVISTL